MRTTTTIVALALLTMGVAVAAPTSAVHTNTDDVSTNVQVCDDGYVEHGTPGRTVGTATGDDECPWGIGPDIIPDGVRDGVSCIVNQCPSTLSRAPEGIDCSSSESHNPATGESQSRTTCLYNDENGCVLWSHTHTENEDGSSSSSESHLVCMTVVS